MEIWSVDRLEGGYALCHGPHGREEIPLSQLPSPLREGDCLRLEEGRWLLDHEETSRRREEAFQLAQRLFRKKTQE